MKLLFLFGVTCNAMILEFLSSNPACRREITRSSEKIQTCTDGDRGYCLINSCPLSKSFECGTFCTENEKSCGNITTFFKESSDLTFQSVLSGNFGIALNTLKKMNAYYSQVLNCDDLGIFDDINLPKMSFHNVCYLKVNCFNKPSCGWTVRPSESKIDICGVDSDSCDKDMNVLRNFMTFISNGILFKDFSLNLKAASTLVLKFLEIPCS